MARESIDDLEAFVMVARERSFTRAAAQLAISPSALSQTISTLEARLGIRLLTRTTRSVGLTEAGERILKGIGDRLDEIRREVSGLYALRDKPAGTIRITADEYAAEDLIWPVLERFFPQYPDIKVEVVIDYGLSDIVAERYDAGVRLGETVAKDMIAVPIGPKTRMVAVATPSYFVEYQKPKMPQDLTGHRCINFRLPTHGGLYAWEFAKGGRTVNVRVDGPLICNGPRLILKAALSGSGVAFLPETEVQAHVEAGELVVVLNDWSPFFPGYHLYYPSRRQHTPAFALLVEALRYRTPS